MSSDEQIYPDVWAYPAGRGGQGLPEVVIKDRGCELVLVFPDMSGEGNIRELRLLPDAEELEPRVLRRYVRR